MTIYRRKSNQTQSACRGLRLETRSCCLFLILLLLCAAPSALGQSEGIAEYRVKLAFLYNFAQFVSWPPETFSDANAPLNLCVLGTDPFAGELAQSLTGRTAKGHPIQIRKLKAADDPKSCNVLFVRESEKAAARTILHTLKGCPTLTVGEAKGFIDMGGEINLILEDSKLHFEINMDAATESRLRISSKLLALAKIVKPEPKL
jgi:hypothetical protein